MEVKEGGLVIIKGDNIENGGLKIVRNYAGEEPAERTSQPLTKEILKKKIDFVKPRITAKKQYFSVCRYMMWEKFVPEGDFKKACDVLEELYPGLGLDPKDMNRYYSDSFKKRLEEWDPSNAPVQGSTYNKYFSIANLLYL